MCVIISKRLPGKLDPDIAARAVLFNPHGFGIMLLDTGEVIKTMDITEAYEWLATERPYVFHARLRTAGKINKDNVQPIMINERSYLFHNGTVQTPRGWDKNASDSRFVAETLRSTPSRNWRNILTMTDSRFLWTHKGKDGVIKAMISGKWHVHQKTFYSKDNVLSGNFVAVYGTLRSGYGNNHLLSHAKRLDKGHTVDKLRMTCQGIPYVLSGASEEGYHVVVEVYNVADDDMHDLDRLEGHPNWYQRRKTKVRLDCGIEVEAWLYFNDTYDNGVYYEDYRMYRQPEAPITHNTDLPDPFTDDIIWDAEEQKYFNLDTQEYIEEDPNQLKMWS